MTVLVTERRILRDVILHVIVWQTRVRDRAAEVTLIGRRVADAVREAYRVRARDH